MRLLFENRASCEIDDDLFGPESPFFFLVDASEDDTVFENNSRPPLEVPFVAPTADLTQINQTLGQHDSTRRSPTLRLFAFILGDFLLIKWIVEVKQRFELDFTTGSLEEFRFAMGMSASFVNKQSAEFFKHNYKSITEIETEDREPEEFEKRLKHDETTPLCNLKHLLGNLKINIPDDQAFECGGVGCVCQRCCEMVTGELQKIVEERRNTKRIIAIVTSVVIARSQSLFNVAYRKSGECDHLKNDMEEAQRQKDFVLTPTGQRTDQMRKNIQSKTWLQNFFANPEKNWVLETKDKLKKTTKMYVEAKKEMQEAHLNFRKHQVAKLVLNLGIPDLQCLVLDPILIRFLSLVHSSVQHGMTWSRRVDETAFSFLVNRIWKADIGSVVDNVCLGQKRRRNGEKQPCTHPATCSFVYLHGALQRNCVFNKSHVVQTTRARKSVFVAKYLYMCVTNGKENTDLRSYCGHCYNSRLELKELMQEVIFGNISE